MISVHSDKDKTAVDGMIMSGMTPVWLWSYMMVRPDANVSALSRKLSRPRSELVQ